jgi:SAM-dependent methyltransferase
MDETSKTKKIWSKTEWSYLQGEGIDIGCGADPVTPDAQPFDVVHGDANNITAHVTKKYDFVFSSHCLEHLHDPRRALREWYSILKPGGHLFVVVPDEDLYEQGHFPSRFNTDHKWTFTISKRQSWSPRSLNMKSLAEELGGEILSLELQDHNYDYQLMNHRFGWWGYRLWRWFKKIVKLTRGTVVEKYASHFYRALGGAFDQTWMGSDRLAQIQLVIKKK